LPRLLRKPHHSVYNKPLKIAVFEPYYGGSHKAFIQALQARMPYEFVLYTLPATRWKHRMRLAAPHFASFITNGTISLTGVDAILCSPFLDVAVFKGLLPQEHVHIPIYTYFHENQFAYPVQVHDERDLHFSLTNLTTALASDKIAFNSRYNFDSFCKGCRDLLRMSKDMPCADFDDLIREKARILYPVIDLDEIDRRINPSKHNEIPVIVWNHRWEHDKNPELFFTTLMRLKEKAVAFQLIVLGQSFQEKPEIFQTARNVLDDRILHCGYVDSREEYLDMLCRSDFVVSTADHEFYGISIIEAVRAGCYPLVPDRLSYRELFPAGFRYVDEAFEERLVDCLKNRRITQQEAIQMTDRFGWDMLHADYCNWFDDGYA